MPPPRACRPSSSSSRRRCCRRARSTRGPEGLRQLWQTWTGAFEDFRIEIEETIDAGDKVIVMAAVAGTGIGTGLEVRSPSFAWVWSFEGDAAVRMEAMPNRATAMEAVGLSE